jgi:hypothetical protein
MSHKNTEFVTAYRPMEGFSPAGSKSGPGLLRALVDFPEDLTNPRDAPKRKVIDREGPS